MLCHDLDADRLWWREDDLVVAELPVVGALADWTGNAAQEAGHE